MGQMKRVSDQRKRHVERCVAVKFGQRCEKLRLDMGMDKTTVARKAGISLRHYYRIEKGENSPSLDTAENVCGVFGVKLRRMI